MSENHDLDELELSDAELLELLRNHGVGRRTVMRALGAGAAVAGFGGVGAASSAGDGARESTQPAIDPTWGYNALSEDEVPQSLAQQVAHTVTTRGYAPSVRPGPEPGVDPEPPFDFIFDPVGLQVQSGDVVAFTVKTVGDEYPEDDQLDLPEGEHTTTAYHGARQRQTRVPEGVQPFSSPMHGPGMVWLYRFEQPGIYDVFCAPHESLFGMVMRIVVGDGDYEEYPMPDAPVGPFGFARNVFQAPEMEAAYIQSNGPVRWQDLTIEAGSGE